MRNFKFKRRNEKELNKKGLCAVTLMLSTGEYQTLLDAVAEFYTYCNCNKDDKDNHWIRKCYPYVCSLCEKLKIEMNEEE